VGGASIKKKKKEKKGSFSSWENESSF